MKLADSAYDSLLEAALALDAVADWRAEIARWWPDLEEERPRADSNTYSTGISLTSLDSSTPNSRE
jgi:hypothetical protein